MKKSILGLIASLVLVFVLAGTCDKASAGGVYVFDDGEYLTADEEARIQSAIESVRDEVEADFLVVFTGNPATGYNRADAEAISEAWVKAGNGYGKDHETILFYVNMDPANGRGVYIDEYSGDGKPKLKDSEIDAILDGSAYYNLADGNYGSAALSFVREAADYAKPGFFETIWGWLVAGLGGGGIVTKIGVGKHQARTAVTKRHYLLENSLETIRKNDSFAGTTTIVRQIPRETPPSGGSMHSGGNNIHSSAGISAGHHGGGKTF